MWELVWLGGAGVLVYVGAGVTGRSLSAGVCVGAGVTGRSWSAGVCRSWCGLEELECWCMWV